MGNPTVSFKEFLFITALAVIQRLIGFLALLFLRPFQFPLTQFLLADLIERFRFASSTPIR